MRIDVQLNGWLAGRLPGGRGAVDVPEAATPLDVMDAIGVPVGACIFVVDGEIVKYDAGLRAGDRLEVTLMAAGG
jgi:sulfur carrier protein ThiS